MSIEIFTKEEFEQKALPIHSKTKEKMWEHLGLISGEHAYKIKIDSKSAIEVRSSVGNSGISASTGEDSIRAWIVDSNNLPMGSKVSKWTTRKTGWEIRTKDVLRTLWTWRKKAGDCPKCGEPNKIFKVKKEGKNKGRVFCKCDNCPDSFKWLTEPK